MPINTLKLLREINDYKQSYIAEDILNISQNTYSRLEQNPDKLTASQLQKLSKLYSVSIENLMPGNTVLISFTNNDNENEHKKNGIIIRNIPKEDAQLIQHLKEELEYLRSINIELQELVAINKKADL